MRRPNPRPDVPTPGVSSTSSANNAASVTSASSRRSSIRGVSDPGPDLSPGPGPTGHPHAAQSSSQRRPFASPAPPSPAPPRQRIHRTQQIHNRRPSSSLSPLLRGSSSPDKFANLPPEIIWNISQCLTTDECGIYHSKIHLSDLLNFSSTCSRLRNFISPIIWHTFKIVEQQDAVRIIVGLRSAHIPKWWIVSTDCLQYSIEVDGSKQKFPLSLLRHASRVLYYSATWISPETYIDIPPQKAALLDSYPEASAISLFNRELLPNLKEVHLSGTFWTVQRCDQAARSIMHYDHRQILVRYFHIGGASLSLELFPPLKLMYHISHAYFRIEAHEIDLVTLILPNLLHAKILEIETAPRHNYSAPNPGGRSIAQVSCDFLVAIGTMPVIEQLILHESTLNAIIISTIDGSWIPETFRSLQCCTAHLSNTNQAMNLASLNHITELNISASQQTIELMDFPFSNLTSLQISDDWSSHLAYQGEMIRQALFNSRHTLKTVICYSLDMPELMFIARSLRNIEVLKVFQLKERWNSSRVTLSALFEEFIRFNGAPFDKTTESLANMTRVSQSQSRTYSTDIDFSCPGKSPFEDGSSKHRRPIGKLRDLTLPVQMKSIYYCALERFILHFRTLETFVLYYYYPLLFTATPAILTSRHIREKIQDLLAEPPLNPDPAPTIQQHQQGTNANVPQLSSCSPSTPPGVTSPSSVRAAAEGTFSLEHSSPQRPPTSRNEYPITEEQRSEARRRFGTILGYCPSAYIDIYDFDTKVLHFFVRLDQVRDNPFMTTSQIRRVEGEATREDNIAGAGIGGHSGGSGDNYGGRSGLGEGHRRGTPGARPIDHNPGLERATFVLDRAVGGLQDACRGTHMAPQPTVDTPGAMGPGFFDSPGRLRPGQPALPMQPLQPAQSAYPAYPAYQEYHAQTQPAQFSQTYGGDVPPTQEVLAPSLRQGPQEITLQTVTSTLYSTPGPGPQSPSICSPLSSSSSSSSLSSTPLELPSLHPIQPLPPLPSLASLSPRRPSAPAAPKPYSPFELSQYSLKGQHKHRHRHKRSSSSSPSAASWAPPPLPPQAHLLPQPHMIPQNPALTASPAEYPYGISSSSSANSCAARPPPAPPNKKEKNRGKSRPRPQD